VTRNTSLMAYHQIIDGGLLKRQSAEVYAHLFTHGPLTGRELDARLARVGETRTSYHKRLSELRDCGVLAEVGERRCQVSGELAIIWDVTDALPVQPAKRLTLREQLDAARAEIAELRAVIAAGGYS